jgi:hypothetical protein
VGCLRVTKIEQEGWKRQKKVLWRLTALNSILNDSQTITNFGSGDIEKESIIEEFNELYFKYSVERHEILTVIQGQQTFG